MQQRSLVNISLPARPPSGFEHLVIRGRKFILIKVNGDVGNL